MSRGTVTDLIFELVVDGKRARITMSPDKTIELMTDPGPIGGFLRQLADLPARVPKPGDSAFLHAGDAGRVSVVAPGVGIIVLGKGGRS